MNEEAILLPALKNAVLMTIAALFALAIYALRHTGWSEFNYRRWFFENRWRIALAGICVACVTTMTILDPDTFKAMLAGGYAQFASAIGTGLFIGASFIVGIGKAK